MVLTRSKGVSLVEILVGLVILALLAGGLHQFYVVVGRSVAILATASQAEDGARIAVEVIARDLRSAGFSPDGALHPGVLYAATDAVRVARDFNGDGDTADANERVGYSFDPSGRRLMRRMGDAPAQPMLDHLAAQGLRFAYRDEGGSEIHPNDGGLGDKEREEVRRIDVVLVLELPSPDPQAREPIRARQTATVDLRNGNAKAH